MGDSGWYPLLLMCTRKYLFAIVSVHYTDIADVINVLHHLWAMKVEVKSVPVLLLVALIPAYRNLWYLITAIFVQYYSVADPA